MSIAAYNRGSRLVAREAVCGAEIEVVHSAADCIEVIRQERDELRARLAELESEELPEGWQWNDLVESYVMAIHRIQGRVIVREDTDGHSVLVTRNDYVPERVMLAALARHRRLQRGGP